MATVVNIKKDKYNTDIMRGSRYGNPFPISRTCSRSRAIDSFEDFFVFNIRSGEVTFEELVKLNSAILGCCCKPQPCHGDVISKYASYAAKGIEELTLHINTYKYKVLSEKTLKSLPKMMRY